MPEHPEDRGGLVEPEGVNAGGPVDGGRPQAQPEEAEAPGEDRAGGGPPPGVPVGQGIGELLSRPGSDHGVTRSGPGQEMSAGEG